MGCHRNKDGTSDLAQCDGGFDILREKRIFDGHFFRFMSADDLFQAVPDHVDFVEEKELPGRLYSSEFQDGIAVV